MKQFNEMVVIDIDHGYGNMKTANCCFLTGVMKSDTEPTFIGDLLQWNGKYYSIGVGHKEFTADKFNDEDYYVLTLAAIARELRRERITESSVFIAAGLPLTWVSEQKAEFKNYLLQNSEVEFTFRNTEYRIKIVGAEIYPQGFAAIVNNLNDFTGVNMLCDIGNGTMNIMFVNDKKPNPANCYTEKFGTHKCMLEVQENLMRVHHTEPPEEMITRVLRFGTADIDDDYLKTIINTARDYVKEIFIRLRKHGYDPKLMKLYVVGGGGCLIRNFADYDKSRVTINDDICATAKGYERMLEMKLLRNGAKVWKSSDLVFGLIWIMKPTARLGSICRL